MKYGICRFCFLLVLGVSVTGCPLSMEDTHNDLRLYNVSSIDIKILLNLNYPDSSFEKTISDRYLESGEEGFVGNRYQLKSMPGLSLYVFSRAYYNSQWKQGAGQPHQFLARDSILARYVLSRKELDSLNWKIKFP